MLQDYCGFGALAEALAELEGGGYRRLFVVASAGGWKRFNAKGPRPFFANREVELFSDFANNPDISQILAGVERYRAFKPDLIVAIGGGSAMDVAKMVKVYAHTRETYDPLVPETVKPSGEGPPLVAIATTSGSGSEATQYGVFYRGEAKQSVGHPSLRPEMAVVDPELTYSLPPHETASTGMDALSQSVEAYWSSNTCAEAQELAAASIKAALPNLLTAVTAPDPGSRYNMAQAAYLSGKAIAFTKTTMPHALAYHLTQRHGLPHGHACAITLPFFFRLNVDPRLTVITPVGPERHYRNMANLAALFAAERSEEVFGIWRALLRSVGLASRLSEVGLRDRETMRALTGSVYQSRMKNHPVSVDMDWLADYFLEHDGE